MKENILIINICKEELHALEFVEPVKAIIQDLELDFFEKPYLQVNEKDLKKCSKIIICGTSLFDNEFGKNIKKFNWLKDLDKPLLGICGGMQIIGLIFGGKIKRCTEIGFYTEYFEKEFLGLKDKCEVYHLHNNHIDFLKMGEFDVFCGGDVSQAVKHKEKEIYGVLFHPEVRQKDMINHFLEL